MVEGLLKKLRYKEGPAAVLNPPLGYELGIETDNEEEKLNFVQLFVNNRLELENWLPRVIPRLNDDAIFWVTYPKQSSKVKTDINRDSLAEIVQDISTYRPVSAVSVDEKWSAMRLREKEKVKSKK
jgi:hypothetical protein